MFHEEKRLACSQSSSPVIQLADGSDFFFILPVPHSAERCSPGLALKFKLHFNACWFTNWVEQNITWLSIVAELITDEVKRFYCLTHLTHISTCPSSVWKAAWEICAQACQPLLCAAESYKPTAGDLRLQWFFFFKKLEIHKQTQKTFVCKSWLAPFGFLTSHIFRKAYPCRADLSKQRLQDKETWLSQHFTLST